MKKVPSIKPLRLLVVASCFSLPVLAQKQSGEIDSQTFEVEKKTEKEAEDVQCAKDVAQLIIENGGGEEMEHISAEPKWGNRDEKAGKAIVFIKRDVAHGGDWP